MLRAYEHRCAVCDFDLRIANVSFGLKAAHIMVQSARPFGISGGPP